ncbi:MAG: glycerol-3-phosphate cytidylyltransferase [Mediterranea massiliensis]|nr:glycerol-3-phosphate cytidylyltransferase [Mediterranea massiliensis]
MKKVITYGTYDLLHFGHIRLLERAKALGDYLIVGVTADDFDKARGKINVQQSLMERMDAVRATGLADEIIVEEYEGQKIDDILRYEVNIFAIGSDWETHFDYLNDYCKVVYLERTAGVSSSELRAENSEIHLGIVGDTNFLNKFVRESHFVNGVKITGICTKYADNPLVKDELVSIPLRTDDFIELLEHVDSVYVLSSPDMHYQQIKLALQKGKHVLCEPPIALNVSQWDELQTLAIERGVVLMDAIRTAYSMAYYRLLLLVKSGVIGQVVSIDSSCTSLRDTELDGDDLKGVWNSICLWGPYAMLPIFQILGVDYFQKQITSRLGNEEIMYDTFSKVTFVYPHAVASIKVGKGVKTEGELVISGTKGYIYVPAPWWKTDYFEIRREDPTQNRRYFYQLDGEGIRFELVSFLKAIKGDKMLSYVAPAVSQSIVRVIEDFYNKKIIKL